MKPYFKPHCKPLANHVQTAWRKAVVLRLSFCILHSAFAAVPVAWTNSPGMPPYPVKPVPHGVPVDFRVTLKGYTSPLIAPGADLHLWYQTNGMGRLWWPAPAALEGDAIVASFGPAQDTGADRVSLFFGAPSNVFASAVLRLTHSPGFAPNILPPPEQATFEETDPVFSTWLATTNLVYAESDPTVPAWAKAENPPASGLTTNDVCGVVTNETVEFTEWVSSAPDVLPSSSLEWNVYDGGGLFEDWGWICQAISYYPLSNDTNATRVTISASDVHIAFPEYTSDDDVVFTRTRLTRNSLGLSRLVDLPPLTNAIPDAAARAVYDVHDLMWDATESILYGHKIRQGHDEYIAVTNIDLTHPTNAVILKAWREANQ